jgi:DNA polymerase III delta prime subunit
MTGPQGSGKSAAVYAVAEELGWEVFEVYPGIGRRTGSNLMSLVGDVGKNHVITGKATPKKAKAASTGMPKPIPVSFFGAAPVAVKNGVARKRANQLPMSSQGSEGDPMRLDDSDEEKEEEAEVLEDRKHGFRQSLILLDEADLLFDEESSFWPAVISLIAESRRPIILTCNGELLSSSGNHN